MMEIDTISDFLEYYGELARDEIGRIVAPVEKNTMSLVRYESVGVIGCIIPWNYPLALMGWKLAPALAAGNTVVMKPSEVTPLSILHWCKVIDSILPPGVINVVTGYGQSAGEPIVMNPDVPVITFTGSVATGKKIANLAAKNLKKVSLELGGKDPMIVLKDADINRAVECAAFGGLSNAGQTCISTEEIFVESQICDKFIDAMSQKIKSISSGNSKSDDLGPMIVPETMEKVKQHIDETKQICLIVEGGAIDKDKYVAPTLIVDPPKDLRVVSHRFTA